VGRTFKELKSGIRLGQMRVTKDEQRVRLAILLSVMAYLLLARLYRKKLEPDQGGTIFQLKQRLSEKVWRKQFDRFEAGWSLYRHVSVRLRLTLASPLARSKAPVFIATTCSRYF
jgi:hypothetical protein